MALKETLGNGYLYPAQAPPRGPGIKGRLFFKSIRRPRPLKQKPTMTIYPELPDNQAGPRGRRKGRRRYK